MIEEHVNELAELQTELIINEAAADNASRKIDDEIAEAKMILGYLDTVRKQIRHQYEFDIAETNNRIEAMKECIIDEWTSEKKTLKFDAGTLKFRTTQSLNIEKKSLVLAGLLDHTSVADVATNYITGFNKTAVKKYMGVLSLPMGAAWIERKTTVKLEQK